MHGAASFPVEEPRTPKPFRMLWITLAWGACFLAIR